MEPCNYSSRDDAPEVALVFPPLVDTSFGSYFPSTAVLAAFLRSVGVTALQEDLNEMFALYLLDDDVLGPAGEGLLADGSTVDPDAIVAVAARMLARGRASLFDAAGRHAFRNDLPGIAHLLSPLARPYISDRPLDVLLRPDDALLRLIQLYRTFYEATGFADALPSSVHTVGISVPMGPQLLPAMELAAYVKRQRPDVRIVCGGPTFSLMDTDDLRRVMHAAQGIDAVVRFDGEKPLAELVERWRRGVDEIDDIAGVASRSGGSVTIVPPAQGLRLDDLPFAEYDPALLGRLANPELGIIQARGCYWGECAYCDFVELYDGSPSYRTRTARRFVDELEFQIRTHGVNRFDIITEAIPPAFARHISEELLARGLEARWTSFAMVERRFTAELFELMVRAGCEFLVVGVETMVGRVLKHVRKAASEDDNRQFLVNAHGAGIGIHINLIPDLPTTTYEEAIGALEEFRRLRRCFRSVAVFPFEATRSSDIGREPETFGLHVITAGGTGQAQNAINHLSVIDPGMSPDERAQAHRAYFEFADEVGADSFLDRPLVEETTPGDALLCLADDLVDIVDAGDSLQCYHAGTRKLVRMHKGWRAMLELVRSMGEFRAEQFVARFDPPDVGRALFRQLCQNRLLEIVGPDARRHEPVGSAAFRPVV